MIHRTNPSVGLRAKLLGATALAALAASLGVATPDEADAAGFALKEQSAAAQGNAFAGATSGAEDVSYMFFNPAGLTRHEGSQAAVVLSYVAVTAETNNATANPGAFGGEPNADGGESSFVPAAYGLFSITPDLKLGIGINVPFGLKTEYSQTWAGRYHAVESEVTTVNINPAVAYRVNEMLSVGIGLQAEQIDVTLSNMVPTAAPPTPNDVLFEVSGDDWDFGFNLGAMLEFSPDTRVGLSYRSQIEHDVSGSAFLGVAANNTTAKADVTLPDMAQLGLYHNLTPELAVMGEIGWTGWSSLDQLQVNLASDIGLGTTTVSQTYDWDDVWFFALGATWRPNEQWTLRGGVAFDQSPIPDATRTPRIPGADRTWVSLGARYQLSPNFAVDAGYTHIFVDDGSVSLPDLTGFGGLPGLDATFDNSVDIVTVQATVRF